MSRKPAWTEVTETKESTDRYFAQRRRDYEGQSERLVQLGQSAFLDYYAYRMKRGDHEANWLNNAREQFETDSLSVKSSAWIVKSAHAVGILAVDDQILAFARTFK